MSWPSILLSVGVLPPASFTNVGRKSMLPTTASQALLAAILPGHQAIVGSRTPPSQVLPLPPRSGPASPPSFPCVSQGPLSLLKTTNVLLLSFKSRKASSTLPTLQSTSSTQAP